MKNTNSSGREEEPGVGIEIETIDYQGSKQELIESFEKLAKFLIQQYDKYLKSNENEVKRDDEDDSNRLKNEYEIVDDPGSKNTLSKSVDLEAFLKYFDKLIEFVLNLKQDKSFVLLGIFQKTNLVTIKLIEFLNKLLNIFNQRHNDSNEYQNFKNLYQNLTNIGIDAKISIVGKTIQFLHVLTTNQSDNNDDDESSVYYCNLLTTCYNFTSSISSLLVINFSSEQKSILSEQYSKACLDVLNNLTFDNRLFTVDTSTKKLIFILVDKITRSDLRPNYFQFLSNILRNEGPEVAKMFKSMDETTVRRFYRQLISIIKDNTNGLVLLSLMILIKLEYEDLFSIVLPIKQKTNIGSTYEPIDCAMGALNDLKGQKKINSTLLKSNAINFLYEFIKCEPVRALLEGNEGYMNVLMFKLNQFLVQSHSNNVDLPLNVSIKVIKLFDQLISSSEKFAKKQYQIIFDTKNFVESSSTSPHDLSSKLKDLALTNKKSDRGDYDYIVDYYIKITEIKENSSDEDAHKFDHLMRNSSFYVMFFKHLFNLFKKNENFRLEFTNSTKLVEILVKNFYHLSSLYLDQSETNDSIIEPNLAKICFYNLGLIDSILRSFEGIEIDFDGFAKILFDSIEQNVWQKLSDDSNENELNLGNYLIAFKLLTRLYINKYLSQPSAKDKLMKFFKNNHVIKAVSYLITKSRDFSYRFTAYEILFDIQQLAKEIDVCYGFHLEAIVKSSLSLKDETRTLPINEIQYPINNFEKTFEPTLNSVKQQIDRKSYGDLDNLFDFYDSKLNEKMRQETYLINTLNQYFRDSLLRETEFKALRDQIRNYALKEIKFKRDLELIETKKAEYEIKYKEMSKCINDLEKDNEKMKEMCSILSKENETFKNKCDKLEKDIEQAEKDNEETVVSLQKLIEKEASLKKELQSKLKDAHQKVAELEQAKSSIESKKKELENKLDHVENDLKEKNNQYEEMSKEFNTVKNDRDRLKNVLSYVKENL